MSLLLSSRARQRPGIIAPMAAVLMVFLLGMVAFTVDIAWMVLAQTELQNVADGAALAGAQPLMEQFPIYAMSLASGQTSAADTIRNRALTQARAAAQQVAAANAFAVGGSKKNYVLPIADIEFGIVDSNYKYTPAASGDFPNTIKVTMRRSGATDANGASNGSLGLFFGPVLGTSNIDLNNVAAATIYGADDQVESPGAGDALLPIAYDKYFWDEFWVTGIDPDTTPEVSKGKARKKGKKSVSEDDGTPKLTIYEQGGTEVYAGNFGALSLDNQSTDSASTRNWIENGITKAEFDALLNSNLLPVSAQTNKWDWQASTGFDSASVAAINDHKNQVSLMPLFQAYNNGMSYTDPSLYQPTDGVGNNGKYNIIGFAPVKIVYTADHQVSIQPGAYIASDETVLKTFGSGGKLPPLDPLKSYTNVIFTYPKLTQ